MNAPRFRAWLACLATLLTAAPSVRAAEAGAWETFPNETNANAWAVYDYAADESYLPDWFNGTGDDDFIYLFHDGDAPLWFFTDDLGNAGNGVMIGNYQTEQIQAIRVSVFINSLPKLDWLDCAIYATGPAGARYYYSEPFFDTDFNEGGWWSLRFGFDETWSYFNGTTYVPVTVTAGMLASVEEIGFRFFPKANATEVGYAAIDNVRLEPKVTAPAVKVSSTATQFRMAFTPAKANFCVIEKWNPGGTPAWSDVVGQTDVTGPGEHVFTTPLAGRGFYRVAAFADYQPFLTPAPAP